MVTGYETSSKLLLRKSYNSLSKPGIKFDKEIIGFILQKGPENILDVGCGNGDLLISIRKNGFRGELFGIDASEEMIREAIQQSKNEKLDIRFSVADAQKLPFSDGYFDIVIAKHMLYHLEDPQKGVNEMHRCLKPNGTLIITLNSERNKPRYFECERMICKKYGLRAEHGQNLVNVENVRKYLKGFSQIRKEVKEGVINAPELFAKYFDSFRDFYEPQQRNELWGKIMKDVESYVAWEQKQKGGLTEICVTGMVTATKALTQTEP